MYFQFEGEEAQDPRADVSARSENRKKIMSQLKAVRQEEIPQEGQPFVLFGPSTDWWDLPTLGRAICFTKSTNSSVDLTQKHPTDMPSIMFDQMSSQADT